MPATAVVWSTAAVSQRRPRSDFKLREPEVSHAEPGPLWHHDRHSLAALLRVQVNLKAAGALGLQV